MNCALNRMRNSADRIPDGYIWEFLEASLPCFLSVLVVILSLIKRESDAVELQSWHSCHMLTYLIQKGLLCKVLNSVKFRNVQVSALLNTNRTIIVCECHIILIHKSIFSLFRWAWVTVLHANFMPIVGRLGHLSALCVHVGAYDTWSNGFDGASTDEAANTGSTMINDTGRLSNTWVHHASLTCCIPHTFAFLFALHTSWDIQNSRADITNASAVFADGFYWFGWFWMMAEQDFTLLNCWRRMSCFANHIAKLRLFHRFYKRWVGSPGVPLWTLVVKRCHCQELATFSTSLA